MRFSEFTEDASSRDEYANVVTALSLIQDHIRKNNLTPPEVSTETVLRFIRNTGLQGFSYQNLLDANSNSDFADAIQNIVKNITNDKVTFNTGDSASASNAGDMATAVDNPEQTVSNMAKSAMVRRQD
tara:strand:+ start:390 stop:773 length:384 start_codon:yes stop_codon:yes gene_type:complete